MKVTLRKWGNSMAVRIPHDVAQAARLALDEVVDVREEAGRVVIEPLRQKVLDLRALARAITAKNRHEPSPALESGAFDRQPGSVSRSFAPHGTARTGSCSRPGGGLGVDDGRRTRYARRLTTWPRP
jgi:antitoxin MazE